jgi:hypothetical protein
MLCSATPLSTAAFSSRSRCYPFSPTFCRLLLPFPCFLSYGIYGNASYGHGGSLNNSVFSEGDSLMNLTQNVQNMHVLAQGYAENNDLYTKTGKLRKVGKDLSAKDAKAKKPTEKNGKKAEFGQLDAGDYSGCLENEEEEIVLNSQQNDELQGTIHTHALSHLGTKLAAHYRPLSS